MTDKTQYCENCYELQEELDNLKQTAKMHEIEKTSRGNQLRERELYIELLVRKVAFLSKRKCLDCLSSVCDDCFNNKE